MLHSISVDVLSRNNTWASSRDAGTAFAGVIYYDGVGFLVNNKLGVKRAKELDGVTICIRVGTATKHNVLDYFWTNNLKCIQITFDVADERAKSLKNSCCDMLDLKK